MKKIILFLFLLLSVILSQAQNIIYQWAKNVGGTNNFGSTNYDKGNSITVDGSGNVYVTGQYQYTADFDPGPGTANLLATPNGWGEIFFSKYDALGNYIWAKGIGGTHWDAGTSIAVDGSGNVYLTGYFRSPTVDFDPGPGVSILTSYGIYDIFFAKYDASGNYIWAKNIGSGGDDRGNGIAVDGIGNVYITGTFSAMVDFDPGPGTANLGTSGANDIFYAKYDASGNYLWAKKSGGNSDDSGAGITLDAIGNIYITGGFQGTADFNPGAGTANLTSAGSYDIFFAKYDATGNYVLAKKMGGTGNESGIGIALDGSGNICVTGFFMGTADFDPGAGTVNLTPVGGADIFFAKYDASGSYLWAKSMGSTGNEGGNSVKSDANGNVYITGNFTGTTDFDPGTGTVNLTSAGLDDIFFAKYDASGNYLWAHGIGGTGACSGNGIAIDSSCNVYITGYFSFTADFDPGPGTANLISITAAPTPYFEDIFFAKYTCSSSMLSTTASSTNILCNGKCTGTGIANPTGGTSPYIYSWNTVPVQTTQVATGLCVGIYTVTVADSVGATTTAAVTITQPTVITLNANSTNNTNCIAPNGTATVNANGGTPVYTYSWSSSPVQTTQTATGLSAGTYTATITDGNGCVQTSTVTISTSNGLTITSSVQTNVLCKGGNNGSANIVVSAGTSPYTYNWSNGQTTTTVTGLVAGSYTILVTDANNCTSLQTVSITEPGAALVTNAITTQTNCNASTGTATATASGGTPTYAYLWSNGQITQTATGLGANIYTVIITDSNGCGNNVSITVTEIPCPCPNLKLAFPNAFSPNNDGENDEICLQGGMQDCITELKIIIYDRWGEKIFKSTDPNFCWDGTYRGKVMNTAVFVYYMEATLLSGEKVIQTGNVSLIR